MTIAYFDCFAGIAGDMILGALLDAGFPMALLRRELKALPVTGYRLTHKTEQRRGLGGCNFHVHMTTRDVASRTYTAIDRMLARSGLDATVKGLAREIFERMARAEARAHRMPMAKVHFHEVGAIDSIVDIVGASMGLVWFNFDAIYCSPLPITRGFVNAAHGRWPIPAPATTWLLKGVPLVAAPLKKELVTPTGAAVITTVATGFGECPLREIETVSYGLGDWDLGRIPNALRLMIGVGEALLMVETNIDDMNPEIYDYLIDGLLRLGAVDVTIRPVLMKKRRPGSQIQVLCEEGLKDAVCELMLRETTSFGVRFYPVDRRMLRREIKRVKTRYGTIAVKCGWLGDELIQSSPEYETCKAVARRKKVPLKEVYRLAVEKALG